MDITRLTSTLQRKGRYFYHFEKKGYKRTFEQKNIQRKGRYFYHFDEKAYKRTFEKKTFFFAITRLISTFRPMGRYFEITIKK